MVALLVIFMIAAFITADVLVRVISKKMQESKLHKERAVALDVGLNLSFADETKSLKRVMVESPKARILAVDDESIILDSFRKILVLAGYSVDTVEKGQEALTLVKKNEYDFVFTDLKMPEMDGIDVTKGVKYLRPDIDVIVITGFATLESAVETMKFGALDYVQKPFTEDELVDFVNKSLIRRQDKIERQRLPKIRLVTSPKAELEAKDAFNVSAGLFVSEEHVWVGVEMDGTVRIGLDDFVQKIVGKIDRISVPKTGKMLTRGQALLTVHQNGRELVFPSPVTGKISAINDELSGRIEIMRIKPYELGWCCFIEATSLISDLNHLRIGKDALDWYRKESEKFRKIIATDESKKAERKTEDRKSDTKDESLHNLSNSEWEAFSKSFLHA